MHPDMKNHTGGCMTLGKGAPYCASTKQKLNTKSSTKSELVGVADVMPQVLWTRYFLKAQGYKVSDLIVYQDNQSVMLLEKNGQGSSSKRTQHINIRYFFVADRITAGEMKVEYCPTGDMLANFFTKPLQGSAFRKFREQILNLKGDPARDHRSVLNNDQISQESITNEKVVRKRESTTTQTRRVSEPLVNKRTTPRRSCIRASARRN
jgi:hypothetical protein